MTTPSPPRRPGDGEDDHNRRAQRTRFLDFLDHVLSEDARTRRLRLLIEVTAKAVAVALLPIFLVLLVVFLVIRVDAFWKVMVVLSALGIGGMAKLRRHLRR
jgi:hypothetical protein